MFKSKIRINTSLQHVIYTETQIHLLISSLNS